METTLNNAPFASPLTGPEPLFNLAGCAITAVFVLSGIDLRVVAWGAEWLRDVAALTHAHDNA